MSMTVRQLKDLLDLVNDDDLVILQRDAEGSGYSPLADAWKATYVADGTYSGEAYVRELNEETIDLGYTDEDLAPEGEGVPAVVLFPIN